LVGQRHALPNPQKDTQMAKSTKSHTPPKPISEKRLAANRAKAQLTVYCQAF
jgi:hypothetical protein